MAYLISVIINIIGLSVFFGYMSLKYEKFSFDDWESLAGCVFLISILSALGPLLFLFILMISSIYLTRYLVKRSSKKNKE